MPRRTAAIAMMRFDSVRDQLPEISESPILASNRASYASCSFQDEGLA
jgi:hypothetical protein